MSKDRLIPLIITSIILLVLVRLALYRWGDFDDLVRWAGQFYSTFGWLILLVSGIIESIILIGLYYPGSTIILSGAALASTGSISLSTVIIWSTLGIVLGYAVSYLAGRAGWQGLVGNKRVWENINNTQMKIQKNKFIYLWATIHPDLGAMVSAAAGVLKIDFWSFIVKIGLCQLFWSTFWAVVFYYFGFVILKRVVLFTVIALSILVIYELYIAFKARAASKI